MDRFSPGLVIHNDAANPALFTGGMPWISATALSARFKPSSVRQRTDAGPERRALFVC